MKIRSGFISNSSSSSFIVFEDLTSRGVHCFKLTKEQMKLMEGYQYCDETGEVNFKGRQGYLTKFITGYYKDENAVLDNVEKIHYTDGENDGEPYQFSTCYLYNEHRHGDESFFVLKEHDTAEQMTISKFASMFKKNHRNAEVLVKYENDGIITLKILR